MTNSLSSSPKCLLSLLSASHTLGALIAAANFFESNLQEYQRQEQPRPPRTYSRLGPLATRVQGFRHPKLVTSEAKLLRGAKEMTWKAAATRALGVGTMLQRVAMPAVPAWRAWGMRNTSWSLVGPIGAMLRCGLGPSTVTTQVHVPLFQHPHPRLPFAAPSAQPEACTCRMGRRARFTNLLHSRHRSAE